MLYNALAFIKPFGSSVCNLWIRNVSLHKRSELLETQSIGIKEKSAILCYRELTYVATFDPGNCKYQNGYGSFFDGWFSHVH